MSAIDSNKIVLLGGGRHAAVLIDALQASGEPTPALCLDDDSAKWGSQVMGVPIRGGQDLLRQLLREGFEHFVLGVGSAGPTTVRRRLFQRACDCGLRPISIRHPTAWRSASATCGEGVQLLPNSVVHTAAQVGENVIVNSGAIVEHDCVVESHCHVATGARLAGGVRLGQGTHIGAGAVVLQGVTIGPDTVVGAGTVVLHDLPAHVVAVGVPARILKSKAA